MFYTIIGGGLDLLIVSLKVGLSLHGFKVQKQRLQLATYLEMKFLGYLLPFAARGFASGCWSVCALPRSMSGWLSSLILRQNKYYVVRGKCLFLRCRVASNLCDRAGLTVGIRQLRRQGYVAFDTRYVTLRDVNKCGIIVAMI